MPPTPYADLNLVLQDLTTQVQAMLGQNFVGAYLQGSFAVGDFDEHSDVDFVIAINHPLSATEVDALQAMHGRIYDGDIAWAKHLEGSYFPLDVLRTPNERGKLLWYLDNGSRALIQSDHCNTALVRWVVREMGVPLAGPPPATLVEPMTVALLRQEMAATLRDWGRAIIADPTPFRNRFYVGFIVLNYCRMLHDLHNGFPGSKQAGADWAKANLDPKWAGLIDRAWDGRPNPAWSVRQPPDPQDFQAMLAFVAYIIEQSEPFE